MTDSRRILHMDSDIPSIYFPIGSIESGGTCEFATKTCIKHCPSGMEINSHERYAYNYFKRRSTESITKKMITDFNTLVEFPYNAKMIQWFTWGDCPSLLTDKVHSVIMNIYEYGIPQYGFTRNKRLWELTPSRYSLNIGLSIENIKKAKIVSIESGKLIGHPDYATGYAEMIFNGKIVSKCNGWWCKTKYETMNSDCRRCLNHMEGCYTVLCKLDDCKFKPLKGE